MGYFDFSHYFRKVDLGFVVDSVDIVSDIGEGQDVRALENY